MTTKRKRGRIKSKADQDALAAAIASGAFDYIGDPCDKCGTRLRNVSQGRCLECARADAYKTLGVEPVTRDSVNPLDLLRTHWLTKAWRAA